MADDKGPVQPDDFEEELKKLPNDLGDKVYKVPIDHQADDADTDAPGLAGCYMLDSIPRFTNDDLDESAMTQDEMEAMMRLFSEEELACGLIAAPGQYVKEMAIQKLVKLAEAVVQMETVRLYMESLGADCDDDMVYAMLSAVGEMSRLRTLIPKIGFGTVEAEGGFDDEEEAA